MSAGTLRRWRGRTDSRTNNNDKGTPKTKVEVYQGDPDMFPFIGATAFLKGALGRKYVESYTAINTLSGGQFFEPLGLVSHFHIVSSSSRMRVRRSAQKCAEELTHGRAGHLRDGERRGAPPACGHRHYSRRDPAEQRVDRSSLVSGAGEAAGGGGTDA